MAHLCELAGSLVEEGAQLLARRAVGGGAALEHACDAAEREGRHRGHLRVARVLERPHRKLHRRLLHARRRARAQARHNHLRARVATMPLCERKRGL